MRKRLDPEEARHRKRESIKKWALEHPDRVREIKTKSRKKLQDRRNQVGREQRAEARRLREESQRKWELDNADVVQKQREDALAQRKRSDLRRSLLFHYGLELSRYEWLFAKQKGKCAICQTAVGSTRGYRLFVDHHHHTQQVRGLLCHRCNAAIGFVDESPSRLARMIAYLDLYGAASRRSPWSERAHRVMLGLSDLT